MTLPVQQPPAIETLRLPKHMYVLMILAIAVGAAAATASIRGTQVTRDTGITNRDDLRRNRELLRSTCENTKAVTEQFTTASPAPCPTPEP